MLPSPWAIHSRYELFYMIYRICIRGTPGTPGWDLPTNASLDINLVDKHLLHFIRSSSSANRMCRRSSTTIWAIEDDEVVVLFPIYILGEIDVGQHDSTFMTRFVEDHFHTTWDKLYWTNTHQFLLYGFASIANQAFAFADTNTVPFPATNPPATVTNRLKTSKLPCATLSATTGI